MKVLICLIGKSGSGKNYIAQKLMKHGLEMIISCTTRQPRIGECDNKDYYFITNEEFGLMESNDEFAEVVNYNGNKYGFTKKELSKIKTKHCLAIVTPNGFEQLSELLKDHMVIPVYLDTDDTQRKEKLLSRHKDEPMLDFYKQQIEERMEQDKKTFARVLNLKNIHIYKVDYTENCAEEIVEDLIYYVLAQFEGRENRRVIVDFDDVIVNTLDETCKLYNSDNGTNLTVNDFKTWDVNSVAKDFYKYFDKVDFESISVKNNAIKWLREINKHYEVVIVTASSSVSFIEKEKWILKNMPFIEWKNIWCVRDKSSIDGYAIIDDGSHNIENSICNRKFLYDMPHNQEFRGYDLRVKNLEIVYDILVKGNRGWY